jgi:hypothetical protein
MKENKTPFDEHFNRRLNDYASSVPDDLFDRLQAHRGGAQPSDTPVRVRLEGHESPVSPHVFDAILAERERHKRRGIVFWRSAMAMAALLLLGMFLWTSKNKNAGAKNEALNASKTTENGISRRRIGMSKESYTEGSPSALKNDNSASNASKLIKNEAINSELNTNKNGVNNNELNASKLIKNNALNSELNANKNGVNNAALNALKTTKKGTNTEGSYLKSENKNLDTKTIKSMSYENNSEKNLSELSTNNAALNSINLIKNNSINSELNNGNLMPNSTIINGDLINKNTPLNSINFDKNALYTEESLSGLNTPLNTPLNELLSPLNSTNTSLSFLNIMQPKTLILAAETNRKNPCSDPENGCPSFGMRRRNMKGTTFYVDAFVAPEFVYRSLTTRLPESEKLLASRDTVETPEYAVSTGLRASVVMSNGLAFRTGLVYSQTNERAQFDSLGMGGGGTEYKWRILPSGQRDTYQIVITTIDGVFRKIRHNQYRSIDIPLQIGYETPRKRGLSFGFYGGVNFNITAWQKADIVGTDLQPLNVSSEINAPNAVFRTQLGMSFIGSVAMYRQLTRGLQFVLEPSLRYGLQPITRSDYALKQQYAMGGLMVGLRLRL